MKDPLVKCQTPSCDQTATVHLTEIVNGKKKEKHFCQDCAQKLELLKQQRPDVAVLDMRLPDTDGVDLLRRIRVDQPELPVIITTAYMSIEPQLKVLDLPHSGYIVKPSPRSIAKGPPPFPGGGP